MNIVHRTSDEKLLIARMERISGAWDGDNPGRAEDRAHTADDIIALVKKSETATPEEIVAIDAEISELLEYLDEN